MMHTAVTRPPCKWPGGKMKLADRVIAQFPPGVCRGTYIEPFVGMGAVLLRLLESGRITRAVAADIDVSVITCWRTIQVRPCAVAAALADLAEYQDEADFYFVRDEQNASGQDPVAHTARMIYLSKLAFGGLFRKNANGDLNMPYGRGMTFTAADASYFKKLAALIAPVDFVLASGVDVVEARAENGDWIYADPPYVGTHAYGGVRWALTDARCVVAVLTRARANGANVVFSEHDTPEIRSILSGWSITGASVVQNIRTNAGLSGERPKRHELIAKLD